MSADIFKNPFFWMVAISSLITIQTVVVVPLATKKATEDVIESLQKEYSPSPYGPGIDADRITRERRAPPQDEDIFQDDEKVFFRQRWESQRGF